MKTSFSIPCKTFSINDKFCNSRSYTTSNYKNWEAKTLYQLDKTNIQEKLEQIRKYLDPSKHLVEINLTAYYPYDILFTKKGDPSSKCHDVTNWEKILVDLLFLPKYFSKSTPYGVKNINQDDKWLFDCNSKKRISDTYSIEIEIIIHDKHDIFPQYFQNTTQS